MIAGRAHQGHAPVLVVGGTGPIGRALSRAAVRSASPIVVSSRTGPPRIDVTSGSMVNAALEEIRPRAVIYLVRSAPHGSAAGVMQAAQDLRRMVVASAKIGVQRVVFASSAAVYGDRHSEPRTEADQLEGTSPYAQEKINAEIAMAEEAAASGLSVVSLRVFNVFGPGCSASLVNALIEGPPPRLAVTAEFVRDYVHVDDVARAFLGAIDSPQVTGALNIGSGHGVSNEELAAARPGAFREGDDSIVSHSVADVTRARALLGWRSRHGVLAYLHDGSPP